MFSFYNHEHLFSDIMKEQKTDVNNKIINNGESKKDNLFTPDEAFYKGTIFKTLYQPYKTYQPSKVVTSNEKERMMNAVQMYALCLNDINLYLAVYPNDLEAMKVRKEYLDKYEMAKNDFERKYQAICVDYNYDINKPYNISVTDFPWESKVNYR